MTLPDFADSHDLPLLYPEERPRPTASEGGRNTDEDSVRIDAEKMLENNMEDWKTLVPYAESIMKSMGKGGIPALQKFGDAMRQMGGGGYVFLPYASIRYDDGPLASSRLLSALVPFLL